jgi:hypothetical protein
MKLLLIACSNRKIRTDGLLPALERYDGGTYRVIRKAQREGYFPPNVDIKILSAKFGLIDAKTPIPYYDQKMDRKRAEELRVLVSRDLEQLIHGGRYSEIFINMGKVYLLAVDSFAEIASSNVIVNYAEGGIGSKAKALKEWLKKSKNSGEEI